MANRCTKCILPDTVPHIAFNRDGICNYCTDLDSEIERFKDKKHEKEMKFLEIIEEVKRHRLIEGGKYDVLVPVSGGRDSSYILWQLAAHYKLKTLCVNYANPYSSQQAIKNVETLIKATKSELVQFKYSNHSHEKNFAANLTAWVKKPDLSSLGLMCLACKPMYLEFFKIAKKNKINLIIDGSNIFEVTTFKMEAQGGSGAKFLFSAKTITRILSKVINNIHYLKICNLSPAVRTFLSLNGTTPFLKKRYPTIKKIGYFYFFPYDERHVNETLERIGWKKAEDNNSFWRFDCEIDSVKNYVYQKTIGATEKDDLFSKYIRYGLMTREEALKRLNEGIVNQEIVERILKTVHIYKSDLDEACRKICNT